MNPFWLKVIGTGAMTLGIVANIVSSKVDEMTRDKQIKEEVEKAVQKRLSQKGS